mmetsp:Transcript_25613/g.52564  ORF Transcript_25613/g.52564 Transcript_25613/m.52564 type:complete len:204 (-) Transcript_25613:226-837(-)
MVLVTVCAPVSCDSTDPSSSSSDGHAEDVPLARSKCCSSKLKLVSSLSLLFSMRGPLIVERKRSWSRMTARSSERDRRMESVWDSRVWILWCMASSSSSSTECVSSSSSWSWSPPSSSSSSSCSSSCSSSLSSFSFCSLTPPPPPPPTLWASSSSPMPLSECSPSSFVCAPSSCSSSWSSSCTSSSSCSSSSSSSSSWRSVNR